MQDVLEKSIYEEFPPPNPQKETCTVHSTMLATSCSPNITINHDEIKIKRLKFETWSHNTEKATGDPRTLTELIKPHPNSTDKGPPTVLIMEIYQILTFIIKTNKF